MHNNWQSLKYRMMSGMGQLMQGRYGVDMLGKWLLAVGFVFLLLARIARSTILYFAACGLVFVGLGRAFSRNYAARQKEGARFEALTGKVTGRVNIYRQMVTERDAYRFFKCPACKRRMKVPRGRGKINIHCPSCGNTFTKKT